MAEQYKRSRSVMEYSRCGSIERYVWFEGALIRLETARLLLQERVRASMEREKGNTADSALDRRK